MSDKQYKLARVKRTRVRSDGTIRKSIETQKYEVKGYLRSDGTRKLKVAFTDEQREEIIRKYKEGVTIKRLQADFDAPYPAIKKVLSAI